MNRNRVSSAPATTTRLLASEWFERDRLVKGDLIMRRVLENLSRGVVLKRRVPKRFGSMSSFVFAGASLRCLKATLKSSAPLFEAVGELVKPGEVIRDIGASVGLFSFCAAYMAGRARARC
jgi:hypothetical protein